MRAVEFQRDGEGHPLDDVIIRGVTRAGVPAVLEVQVKRTITFAPGDSVYREVVGQLVSAFSTLDLTNERRQFAVATDRTSSKITGPYQDVLRWARELGSAALFFQRVNRSRVGNDDMRTFVETTRTHVAASGCASDDEVVWQILRRVQILVFDFEATGSQSVELATERSRHVLHSDDVGRADALWAALTTLALRSAASGGEFDRDRLVSELTEHLGFRLLGTRRNQVHQQALREAASLAAKDLHRTIGGVSLTRSAQLAAVRQAFELGRYIEIRGEPGVGKSGLLGLFVEQILEESHAVVLSPERTISGGWIAFKASLGIEETLQAFLSDLACDGGSILFLDSLDFFDDASKRATVNDFVRSAANVPGFRVIATARSDFDKEEPNWLPADALDLLGRAPPIVIDELGTEEIDELRTGAPALRALLADDHPARNIARNLFRLSRLLEVEGASEDLRSEGDLLWRWWSTADGKLNGYRERARLLNDLAEAAITGSDHLETRASAEAVNALLSSRSLRELGPDRVAFRHDVLREWAVAARLHVDKTALDRLPLASPAPASLVRGVELSARLALERSSDGQQWSDLLARLSQKSVHPSWRRHAMLAIVRSELASELLDGAANALFDSEGALLRELVRTAIAVESRPMVEHLAARGITLPELPSGVYAPANASWPKLALWLLARQADVPLQSLRDIVHLFQSLSVALFFIDPVTPLMANALAGWLVEIEDAQEHSPLAADPPRFRRAYSYQDLGELAEDVRQAFLLMASRAPESAASYLNSLMRRRNSDQTIRSIMQFRGSLAKAAPAELSELTYTSLVEANDDEKTSSRPWVRYQIFSHLDSVFLPTSPERGPFLELLTASPAHGLSLVHRLALYAVDAQSDSDGEDDGLMLELPGGARFFPRQNTYYWSRSADGCYALECALMALEAWSHSRIEKGESIDEVLVDIFGEGGCPAAFVLVAVDILLSHWPKTRSQIIPFLASPELLSLERSRQTQDAMSDVDILGYPTIASHEPRGHASLAGLRSRASRRFSLESVLPAFAQGDGPDRQELRRLLAVAADRLGPPQPSDTFTTPRFMACYALNLTDPSNWRSEEGNLLYFSPPDEVRHLAELQAENAAQAQDVEIDSAIHAALELPSRSSAELVTRAVEYAKRLLANDAMEGALGSRYCTIAAAAMMVSRDGSDELFSTHGEWARKTLGNVLETTEKNSVRKKRNSIRFNPVAIATLGIIHLWRRELRESDRDWLLNLAVDERGEAAPGFGAGADVIRTCDARVIRALLRCSLSACIHPCHLSWDEDESEAAAKHALYRRSVETRVAAECAWLLGKEDEPQWPAMPPRKLRERRSLVIGRRMQPTPPDVAPNPANEVYEQDAAMWVRNLTHGESLRDAEWIRSFISAYSCWTAQANGAGAKKDIELQSRPLEWNHEFYRVLGSVAPYMQPDHALELFSEAISVPDASFYDVAAQLVPHVDAVYFSPSGVAEDQIVRLRESIVQRMIASDGWLRTRDSHDLSIEMHLGPAVAAIFFNNFDSMRPAKAYLLAPGISRIKPFLSQLTRLNETGSVPFTTLLTMNLMEVSPCRDHLEFFLANALEWLRRHPENSPLWVDGEFGSRIALWLEAIVEKDPELISPDNPLRAQMDEVLGRLVRTGVAEAHRVERLFDPG